MRQLCGIYRRCSGGAIAALLFLLPVAAWGESCPFCYSKAMSSSAGMLQAFRSGIIILMIPPFLMSIGITLLVYKRRNSFRSP
jgi:hypothetical protein